MKNYFKKKTLINKNLKFNNPIKKKKKKKKIKKK